MNEGSVEQSADGKTSSNRYVAAFRTYGWDDGIAELARRFFAATPGSRQVVLVDETRGPIKIPGYEIISHTTETACPALPNYPKGRSLWFNVDYGVYALRRKLPEYEYFLLSEADLAVNLSLEPMMRFAISKSVDFMAHKVEPSKRSWFWHPHGLSLSAKPWRSLLFLMVLSGRAIDNLYAARLSLAQRFTAGEVTLWPFCEAFVPTVLKATPGMRFGHVSKFADTENLVYRPQISLHDPRANRPGSLAHAVLGGKKFVSMLLSKHSPADFFREGSELRDGLLSQARFENFVEPLRHALAVERDYAGLDRLRDEGFAMGWPVDRTTDVAFCKPAVSSSVSHWSPQPDPESDARRANGNILPPDFGFHTLREANPWWMVDLLDEHLVEEVAIVNRVTQPERFKTFFIETSCDGNIWITRFQQTEPINVSSDPRSPWRFRFNPSILARYLRIVLLGVGQLHLRRIEVFGRVTPGPAKPLTLADFSKSPRGWPLGPLTDAAFCKPAIASSVSRWSPMQDFAGGESGANSDSLPNDCGFHTRKEANPWWIVDLLGEHQIEEVAIVNRQIQAERFRTFSIESSCDGSGWSTRFQQTAPADVSSDPASPWRVHFPEPFPARYLRIVLSGVGPLHLRRIQVFGRMQPGPPNLADPAGASGPEFCWPLGPTTDIAFCKPAVSSSVSPWSRYQDRLADASCANDDSYPHDIAFHTRKEANPWWMVDFLGEHLVEEVTIVNRRNRPERFRTFSIETSKDGAEWTTRFQQTEPGDVSWDPSAPWRLRFPDPFPARYLRIVLLGSEPLHLRQVSVLGRIKPLHGRLSPPADAAGSSQSWPPGPRADVALCKPAVASSVSPWTRYEDPEGKGGGVNGDSLPHDCGFHTRKEANPWWMVDLLDQYLLDEVAIVNRLIQAERFRTFSIETSCDGSVWNTRFQQTEPGDVSSDPGSPWCFRFPEPLPARYVRIILLGTGPLHLRRVQVFGRLQGSPA